MTDELTVSAISDVKENAEGGIEPPAAGKPPRKKFRFFWGVVLVALMGVGAYFASVSDGVLDGADEPVQAAAEPPSPAHYLGLDEMLVTLGGGGKSSFLKMQVTLELEKATDEARIKAVMPRIVDKFHVFLRELRIEELQGSHGLYRVKEELLTRVNAAAHPTKVKDVLFQEMLVQ